MQIIFINNIFYLSIFNDLSRYLAYQLLNLPQIEFPQIRRLIFTLELLRSSDIPIKKFLYIFMIHDDESLNISLTIYIIC